MNLQSSENNLDNAINDLLANFQTKGKQSDRSPQQQVSPKTESLTSESTSEINDDVLSYFANSVVVDTEVKRLPEPPNRLALAKQGNAQAITETLNYLLKPKGIQTKVAIQQNCAFVIIQGESTPDAEEFTSYIKDFINKLELQFIQTIKITGRRKGATFSAWTEEINLGEEQAQQKSWLSSVPQSTSGLTKKMGNSLSQTNPNHISTVVQTQEANSTSFFQEQLTEKMMLLFEKVINDRRKYYAQNPNQRPKPENIPSIINSYANKNSSVVGALNFIPGPAGMAAIVPEISGVIYHQISMIYDIGMAHGKELVLSKELLAGVFAYALGQGGLGLISVHASKILVKRSSVKFFHKILKTLGYKVSKRMLKSIIGKWVPGIGALALAAWENHATREIGKKAEMLVKQKIELSDEFIDDFQLPVESIQEVDQFKVGINDNLKIQSLINLIKIDGKIDLEEREYIHILLKSANIAEADKVSLMMSIDNNTKFSIDYSQFAQSPDDAIELLSNLIALAKRDGEFHISEKMYIKQAGKLMNISENDIAEMMAAS